MLTIGRLASYAGVTTRAVRHYHQVGLLPEPERDASGYRTYAAPAVVRLIRIKTLAEAGVPLARVQELLDADGEEFARAVGRIDRRLRGEIEELKRHRRQVARLTAGDGLALPPAVTAYLDRMRAMGVADVLVETERDAWILIAAQWPEKIADYMVVKVDLLDDPLVQRFYRTMSAVFDDDDESEARLVETADVLVELAERAAANGSLEEQDAALVEGSFVDLLDTVVLTAGPRAVRVRDRLQELMAERGWSGLVNLERVDP